MSHVEAPPMLGVPPGELASHQVALRALAQGFAAVYARMGRAAIDDDTNAARQALARERATIALFTVQDHRRWGTALTRTPSPLTSERLDPSGMVIQYGPLGDDGRIAIKAGWTDSLAEVVIGSKELADQIIEHLRQNPTTEAITELRDMAAADWGTMRGDNTPLRPPADAATRPEAERYAATPGSEWAFGQSSHAPSASAQDPTEQAPDDDPRAARVDGPMAQRLRGSVPDHLLDRWAWAEAAFAALVADGADPDALIAAIAHTELTAPEIREPIGYAAWAMAQTAKEARTVDDHPIRQEVTTFVDRWIAQANPDSPVHQTAAARFLLGRFGENTDAALYARFPALQTPPGQEKTTPHAPGTEASARRKPNRGTRQRGRSDAHRAAQDPLTPNARGSGTGRRTPRSNTNATTNTHTHTDRHGTNHHSRRR